MAEGLCYQQEGPIVLLALDDRKTRNALSPALIDALVEACAQIEGNRDVRAAIIHGKGGAFCSGANIHHVRERSGMFAGDALQVRDNYCRGIQRLSRALYDLEIPTIAAINGPAYGAGCDLALMCDIRLASPNAAFAENFVKLNLVSGDGGIWHLLRIVGVARACEMAFTGEPIDAYTAERWGLVSRIFEEDHLLEAARELATRIAANPPQALRMTKRLLRQSQQHDFDSLLQLAAALQGAAHQTHDHAEAIAALVAKRSPRFSGS